MEKLTIEHKTLLKSSLPYLQPKHHLKLLWWSWFAQDKLLRYFEYMSYGISPKYAIIKANRRE